MNTATVLTRVSQASSYCIPSKEWPTPMACAALQAEASAACKHATDAIDKLHHELERAHEAEAAAKAAADKAAVLLEQQEQQAHQGQTLLQQEVAQATQARDDAVAAATQQNERLAQERQQVAEGREAVSSLEAQLAAALSAKADVDAQLAAALSAQADFEAELAAARTAKADVEAELAAALSARAEVQAAASAVGAELAAAHETSEALQAKLQELQQQNEGLQMQTEELQQQRLGLQTQVEEQQQQLQDAAAAAALLATGRQREQREVAVPAQASLQDVITKVDAASSSRQHVESQTNLCSGLPGVASAPCQDAACQTGLHAHTKGDSTAHADEEGAGHLLFETMQDRQTAGAASGGDLCCSRLMGAQTQTDLPTSEHQSTAEGCCSWLSVAQTQTDLPTPEQQTGQGLMVSAGTQSDCGCCVAEVGVQAQPSTLDAATGTDAAFAAAGPEVGCQTDTSAQEVALQCSATSQTDHQAPCGIEDDAADQQQQSDTVAAAAAVTVDDTFSAESTIGTTAAESSPVKAQVDVLLQNSCCHQPAWVGLQKATTFSVTE